MAYTDRNYKTKKALHEALRDGVIVSVYQPWHLLANTEVPDGPATVEGPHFPAAHSWYATCDVLDGRIIGNIR
tara:strand:+ start:1070 stop:1288 length:219 start_codon:yes stop_codon:yes gene_type:complete